jgi:hypothetical protein
MRNLDGKVRVARLAGRQFGRVSYSQLSRLGVPKTTINRWVTSGYLHPVLPAVYAVGHVARSVEADHAAALLYAGEGSMLSHETAVWWWGLLDAPPWTTHISIPARRESRPRLKIHCRRALDRVQHRSLPVTSVAQTLLDYAAKAPFKRLRYVIAEAEYHGLLDLDALEQIAGPGRPGSKNLRAAIKRHLPQLARTLSELERVFLSECERAGVQPPDEVNGRVEGFRVDFVWRKQKVVVEVDGWRGHGSRARMVRDRRRDLTLRGAGYIVLRYTWDQLVEEPALVMADLTRVLASR